MALKRFLVFAFDPADAAGGWRDCGGALGWLGRAKIPGSAFLAAG